jgi:hypothetical protein
MKYVVFVAMFFNFQHVRRQLLVFLYRYRGMTSWQLHWTVVFNAFCTKTFLTFSTPNFRWLRNMAVIEKFNLYCKGHECPCCRICNMENHKDCKEVTILENITKNVKTSTMFNETEHLIKEMFTLISVHELN